MNRYHLRVNKSIPLSQAPQEGHNRWHPDIEPMISIASGDTVEIETRDSWDCQISPSLSAGELLQAKLGKAHPLTGPVHIDGAEEGDLLEVHIEEIIPDNVGYTVIMPGFGFLRDQFTDPFVVHWQMDGGFATSPELPGVRIPGAPFMGVMGVAPSTAMVASITRREAALRALGGLVFPPDADMAVPATGEAATKGLRTIPPREFGGNMDVKQLTEGATLYLPVYVKGAMFSVGDAHFAQGDGESCGTAIETSAVFTASFKVLKAEAARRHQRDPSFRCNDASPASGGNNRCYVTTGICVTESGENMGEDVTLATRNALLNMIRHICDAYDYTKEQAYALASVAVNLRISQLVDAPNACVSAFLPESIFEQ